MQQNMLELCFDSSMTKPKNRLFFSFFSFFPFFFYLAQFHKNVPSGNSLFSFFPFGQNQLFIYLKIEEFCLTLEAELLKVKVQHGLVALPSS